jgi:tetratricopeptide (TPR) repeat protein
LKSERGDWGWGAVFAAGIVVMLVGSLVASALMDGGWANQRRQVLTAAMLLSATSGFLAIRLFAERSRIGTWGGRLAAATLLFILLVLLCVVVRDGAYDGGTGKLLALAASGGAMMTASATWVWRLRFKWLGLAPIDKRSRRRRESSDALRELNEQIRRNPRDANALAERSKVLLARGECLRALNDLDKALQLDRKNAHHFLYLKHLVRLSQDDFAQSLQDILSAIESDEDRREDYYAAAAIVYVKSGRIDGVAAMLEKQGLPVSRTHAVQVSALNAVLYEVDREISVCTAMLSDRQGSGDESQLNSLRQTRTDILAKLRKSASTPSNVGSGG